MSLHKFISRRSAQQLPHHIPTASHKLRSSDSDLFIYELGKKFQRDVIRIIEESEETYISYNVKINVRLTGVINKKIKEIWNNMTEFRNSCRFMASGLHKLAFNLDNYQCKNFRQIYMKEELVNRCIFK